MAIKGKGKTRSRQVARAPRRAPVDVPKPVHQRTWVQVLAAFLVGAFAIVVLVWITNAIRSSNEETDAEASLRARGDALATWRTEVESRIGTVGEIQDPLPPVVAPEIAAAAAAVAKGKDSPVDEEALIQLQQDLGAAAAALDGFDLAATIRDQGFDAAAVDALLGSRSQLVGVLQALEQGAGLMVVAMGTDDPATAEALAAQAQDLDGIAKALLEDAWRSYRNALIEAKLVDASATAAALQP
jgi:hypothetical protein